MPQTSVHRDPELNSRAVHIGFVVAQERKGQVPSARHHSTNNPYSSFDRSWHKRSTWGRNMEELSTPFLQLIAVADAFKDDTALLHYKHV